MKKTLISIALALIASLSVTAVGCTETPTDSTSSQSQSQSASTTQSSAPSSNVVDPSSSQEEISSSSNAEISSNPSSEQPSSSSSQEVISSNSSSSEQPSSSSSQEIINSNSSSKEQSSSSSSSSSSEPIQIIQITFKVEGQTDVVSSFEYGATPTFDGTPSLDATSEYTYTFKGWSKTVNGDIVDLSQEVVTGEQTYYAVFEGTTRTYIVTLVNNNGEANTVLEDIPYGTKAELIYKDPYLPTLAGHTFDGWYLGVYRVPTDAIVQESMTLEAKFSPIEYTVTWHIGQDTETDELKYNDTPTREDAYLQGYIFLGWSKTENGEIIDLSQEVITGETHYYAVFTDTSVWDGTYPDVSNGYTFKGEGTSTSPYLLESATDLAALSRLTTGKAAYGVGTYYMLTVNVDLSVGGWVPIGDKDTTAAGWHTSAGYFSANFNGNNKTITFKETNVPLCFDLFQGLQNCTVENLVLNGSITGGHYHSALSTYFNGGVVAKNITTNVDITVSGVNDAQARTSGIVGQINGVNNELINCVNNGNITVQTNQSHAGGLVGFAYGKTTLTNCSNTGTITGNVTASTPYGIDGKFVGYLVGCGNGVTFDITFNVEGKETVVSTISGLKPTTTNPTKVDDEKYRYTFAGWSLTEGGEVVDLDYVQKDITYYAVFTKTEFYNITFDIDGVTSTAKVLKGNTPTYDQEVTKVGYKFLGWGNDKGEVTGLAVATESTTYYAIFEQITEKFKVTWVIDGTTLEEEYVYGSTPTHEAPTKTDYVFIGWAKTENGDIIDLSKETITEITEYYAVFIKADVTVEEFNMQPAHFGGPNGTTNTKRARISFAVKMKAGTTFEFVGTEAQANTYKWTVNETQNTANMTGENGVDYIDAGWNTAPKTTWLGNGWGVETKSTTLYTTQTDCYPVITLARIDGTAFTNDDIVLFHSMFQVKGIKLSPIMLYQNEDLTEEEFKSQVAAIGSYPGPTDNTRGRIFFAVKMQAGTNITYLGDSTYNWAVVETTNVVTANKYLDSGWNNTWTDPNAAYVSKIDGAYLILTVKKSAGGTFTNAQIAELHNLFKVEGKKRLSAEPQVDYTLKSINHRGYNYLAPENTLEAYELSAYYGFKYVECDISFTKDSVPVLLHDASIDRTSNGTGDIVNLTLEEARQYDYGSWFSSDYVGTKIPTFEEFLMLCKELNLHPYIEIKWNSSFTLTEDQAVILVNLVEKCGMTGKVSYISFNPESLSLISKYDTKARLGLVLSKLTGDTTSLNRYATLKSLKTATNEVFVDIYYTHGVKDHANVTLCKNDGVPLEVWTADAVSDLKSLDPYVTGVTAEYAMAGKLVG